MRFSAIAIVMSSVGLFTVTTWAQQPNAPQARANEPHSNSYVPDLGDIMETTQLRHFKLSYAGSSKNWNLANYELSQIRASLENAARFYPDFANIALAKLIKDISEPALTQVGDSIKTGNSAAFARAFDKLTQACNSCHQAAGFSFIVIRVPTASPFTNQLFSPSAQ